MQQFYSDKNVLIEPYAIKRRLPANFSETEDALFRPILNDSSRSVNSYVVKDIYIVKNTLMKGLSFIEKDRSIFTSPPFSLPLKSRLKRMMIFFASKTVAIDKAVWIINDWAGGYFHWFADALPKLLAVEKEIRGHKVLIPESYKKLPFIEQSLQKMGFDFQYMKDEFRAGKDLVKYKVKELLVVDALRYFNPGVMSSIRKRLSENYADNRQPYRKIYISREKAIRRRINNETEVKKAVQEHGFEVHYFEDYDLEKQIELMGQCKYLVSLHGAGLTNTLFMKDGANVMEFKMEGDYLNGCYYSLANSVNINYYYLLCKGNNEVTQDADFIVDTEKLKEALDRMLTDTKEKVNS